MNARTEVTKRLREKRATEALGIFDVAGTCCHQRVDGFSPAFGAAWGACAAAGMQALLVTGDHRSAVQKFLLEKLPDGGGRVVLASLLGHEIHVMDGGENRQVYEGEPVDQEVRRQVLSCYERSIRSAARADFSFTSGERAALLAEGGTRISIGQERMGLREQCLYEGRDMKQTVYFPDSPVASGAAAAVLKSIASDAELNELCSKFRLQRFVSSNFADTVPIGLNKWEAVERANKLGLVDLSRFLLIAGDGRNDYDLLISREIPSTRGVVKAYVGADAEFWDELNGPTDEDLFWLEGAFVEGTTFLLEQLANRE